MKKISMSEEKRLENQKEDKKFGKRFAVIILCSALVGMMCGVVIALMRESSMASGLAEALSRMGMMVAPYISLVYVIVMLPVLLFTCRKVRTKMEAWDGENEEEYKEMDTMLGNVLSALNIGTVIVYFFFAIGFHALAEGSLLSDICHVGGFIGAIALVTIGQKMIINMVKELNPEKRGSVYDTKFVKKWEESCDEAERLLIYKSAYKTYVKMNTLFVGLWLFCIFANEVFSFGFMPVTMVSLIWLCQICLYTYHSRYYEKHPEEV